MSQPEPEKTKRRINIDIKLVNQVNGTQTVSIKRALINKGYHKGWFYINPEKEMIRFVVEVEE